MNMYDENICNEIEKQQRDYHPMSPEIVMTSSFYFNDFDEFASSCSNEFNSYVYTRGTNPTTELLEKKLALLEHGEKCKVFASGMGAISAVFFTLLQQGDHVLLINTVYGATVSLLQYFERYGVTCEVINSTDINVIKEHIQDATRMIYFESPSSQKFEMIDLEDLTSITKPKNILTVIDNTWSSPLFQHPLKHGIDLVVHSLSKYVSGHSDVVSGAVIGSKDLLDKIEEKGFLYLGATCSPMNSYLAIRGMRTLPVRLHALNDNIKKVLDYLCQDSRVKKVYHPYCGNVTQKNIANKYLKGFGSLFAIDLVDEDLDKLKLFVNTLHTFTLGVSWGGFESLILPVFKGNNQEAVLKRGLPINHLRMYVGLEHPDSLIADIQQALDIAYGSLK